MQFASLAGLVAGLAAQQVAATGWSVDAPAYSCPSNTNNQCSSSQAGGYNWDGLSPGSFGSYGSNDFSGWSCSNSFQKRGDFAAPAFQSKCITAPLDNHPSISCQDHDTMSIDQMQISSTADTNIECHYGMPDGSNCMETHSCSAGGSIIQNTQCGGARNVTLKPAGGSPPGCSIGIHSLGFNCGTASSTVPYVPSTSSSSFSTPATMISITSQSAIASSSIWQYTSNIASTSTTTSIAVSSSSASSSPSSSVTSVQSTSVQSTSAQSTSAQSTSAQTTSSTLTTSTTTSTQTTSTTSLTTTLISSSTWIGQNSSSIWAYTSNVLSTSGTTTSVQTSLITTSSSVSSPLIIPSSSTSSSSTSTVVVSSSIALVSSSVASSNVTSSALVSPVSSGPATLSTPASTPITSFSTSTIFTTTVATVTSCAADITNCPAHSTVLVTSTIAISTTICPVTATEIPSSSTVVSPVASSAAPAPPTYPSPDTPSLLPKCLNTWMFETGCKDNADASCYCKDEQFINHVMGCISSWSGSASETSSAASYLMGICAAYIPQNPAIITACPSTVTPAAVSETTTWSVSTFVPPPSTITLYSTQEVTITSCAPTVTNCPARSTVVVTSSIPVSTTLTTPPVTVITAPSSTDVGATQTQSGTVPPGPAPTSPANTPVTVITYSSTITVPCTFSSGVSAGFTIPSSSTVTQLVTTVTVPQVQFTTSTLTLGGSTSTVSVGLGAGSPSSVPAATTWAPVGGASVPAPFGTAGTSFGTSFAAVPTQSGPPITPFHGAGAKTAANLAGFAVGAVAVLFVVL